MLKKVNSCLLNVNARLLSKGKGSDKLATSRTVKQLEIIKGARAVIFSKGIEKLTTRELAKQLNVTNGALYRHFKSKNEIIGLLIDDIEETLLTTIQEAANRYADPLQKLESIFLSHLSYAEQIKGTSFIVINQVSGLKDEHLKTKMFRVFNKYLITIKGIVDQGVETGIFRKDLDSTSASIVFFGSIQSMVTLWCLSGYKLSLKKSYFSQVFDIYKSWLVVK